MRRTSSTSTCIFEQSLPLPLVFGVSLLNKTNNVISTYISVFRIRSSLSYSSIVCSFSPFLQYSYPSHRQYIRQILRCMRAGEALNKHNIPRMNTTKLHFLTTISLLMNLKPEVSLHVSAFKASYLSSAQKKHFGSPTHSKAKGKMIRCVSLSPITSDRIDCTLIFACSVGARKRVYQRD